jgi:predicted signal transduction protein with EAL and GGDEF domain
MVVVAAADAAVTEEVDVLSTILVQRAHLIDAPEPDRCTGGPITTLVLDPDDFHDVADRLGPDVADRILVELADRLQDRLCACGVTTHLAHDTLGIECIGLAGDPFVDADVVRALAAPLSVGSELVEVRPA